MDFLESFVPDGKSLKKAVFGGSGTAKKLESIKLEPNEEHDLVMASSNQATSRLIKRTGQVDVGNEVEQQNLALHKKKHPAPSPTVAKSTSAKSNIAASSTTIKKEDKEASTTKGAAEVQLQTHVEEVALPAVVPPELPIKTLEQHKRRDNQVALFALQIERTHQQKAPELTTKPPTVVNVLSYCAEYKDEMPWYGQYYDTLSKNANLNFQKIPLLSRAFLQDFLRVPNPNVIYERFCFNLDRDPMEHEGRIRCVAHRLSEKLLGPGKGYRLREILFPNQVTMVEKAMVEKRDPRICLSPIAEMCYLCHIWMTTNAALDQKNNLDKQRTKDMTVTPTDKPQMVAIRNRFMVDIDTVGAYDRHKMLVSDDVGLGILGPFPLWNERHYIPVKGGFEESEELLFRLPRELLTNSTQPTPTIGTPARLVSRR